VRSVLCQKNERGSSRDGMEVALCRFDKQFTELMFAGANRPLYYFENENSEHISLIKPTRKGIGGLQKEETRVFENHTLALHSIYSLYLFSDGIVDQNNTLNHKFGSKQLKIVLNSMKKKTMEIQKKNLLDKLSNHQENELQRDDITVIGIKIKD
ncbi:MAG: SpoIIE family protein phosphatase, partial [Candidatus Cloacimonetes bacterium]|nr:SpoIIE family protein phosphatase [Candidatus Cloacimonadota bacterium]